MGWTESALASEYICNTCPPGRQRTSRCDWMMISSARTETGWQRWAWWGRRSFLPANTNTIRYSGIIIIWETELNIFHISSGNIQNEGKSVLFELNSHHIRRHWLSDSFLCYMANSDSTYWSNRECDTPLGRGTRRRRPRTQCGSLCSCLWHRWDSIWWLLASQAERHQASSFLPKTTAAQSVDSPLCCSSCPRKTGKRKEHQEFSSFRSQISF